MDIVDIKQTPSGCIEYLLSHVSNIDQLKFEDMEEEVDSYYYNLKTNERVYDNNIRQSKTSRTVSNTMFDWIQSNIVDSLNTKLAPDHKLFLMRTDIDLITYEAGGQVRRSSGCEDYRCRPRRDDQHFGCYRTGKGRRGRRDRFQRSSHRP